MSFDQIEIRLLEHMGTDAAIAGAAWTSSYAGSYGLLECGWKTSSDVHKLVGRLIAEGHTSPLEAVVFRFHARWPIFVDRQHMTHRMQSSNGLSGRYRTLPSDYYTMPADVLVTLARLHIDDWEEDYNALMDAQIEWYNRCLRLLKEEQSNGSCTNAEYKRVREVLRGVIGTAGMTERVFTINLASFANFQRLRNDAHAQPEICDAAKKMLDAVIAADVCPVAINALMSRGWMTQNPSSKFPRSDTDNSLPSSGD